MRVASKKDKGVYVEKRNKEQAMRRMQNYAIAFTATTKRRKKVK